MLQWHVDVFDQRIVLRERVEQLLRDAVGVGVEEPHPLGLRRFDLGEAGEKLREPVLHFEVLAVAGGVLSDQVDFPNSLAEQAGGFRHDGLETTAPELAPVLRDDAERAGVVAALGDLHVGEVLGGGKHARGGIVVEVQAARVHGRGVFDPLAHGHDAVDFVGPDDGVHLGHVLQDVAPVALDQAPGDDQALRPAHLLVLGHLQDGVDRLLLGGVDETASVDDQHLGLVRMGGELMPAGGELAHHDFRIDQILGATEADKTDLH